MEQHYANPVHMTAFPMQSQHQQAGQQHYPSSHGQYQQLYNEYSDSCYQTPAFHDTGFPGDQYGYHPTSSVPYGTGIESYLDPKYATNPAAFASRLPYLPFHAAAVAAYGMYDYSFEPAFIRKRNERERQRVKCVNEGYARLREHLPEEYAEKRLSKVETLRGAIMYIKQLQSLLGFDPEKGIRNSKEVLNMNSENDSTKKSTEGGCSTAEESDPKNDSFSADSPVNDEEIMKTSDLCTSKENESNAGENKESDVKRDSTPSNSSVKECRENFRQNREQSQSLLPVNCAENGISSCMHRRSTPTRSSVEPQSICNREYSPETNCVLSPLDCRFDEENSITKSCVTGVRNSCAQQRTFNFADVATPTNSQPSFNDNSGWWTRSSTKSTLNNSILDFGDDCSENSSKSFGQNHSDNNDSDTCNWAQRSSSYHPYKRIDSKNAFTDNWDEVFPIKIETHTPPPYDEQYDFSCQQQYSSCHRLFTNSRQNLFRSSHNVKGGQSDGFKTDTSPESLSGLSP